jgi:uncharacterized protein YcbK (DUF882 family)
VKGTYLCKCGCGLDIVKPTVRHIVKSLGISLGAEVTVTSGCRCEKHHINIHTGLGKKLSEIPMGSYHLKGEAADVKVAGLSATRIMKELRSLFGDQLYMYAINETTVHFDIRGMK